MYANVLTFDDGKDSYEIRCLSEYRLRGT